MRIPQKSLSILFDKTNKLNNITISAIETAGIKHVIEFEKGTVSVKSNKL